MTLRTKLIVLMVALGLLPMVTVAFLTYVKTYRTLANQGEASLMTMQQSFGSSVNRYFDTLHAQTRSLAITPDVISALQDFTSAVDAFDPQSASYNSAKLQERYKYQEQQTEGGSPGDAERWIPTDATERSLQGIYIGDNPHPIGEKQNLMKALDGSRYSDVHARYHGYFKALVEEFGLYDIFLIDKASGRIVYSMFKEVDFMRSVTKAPISETQLAHVAKRVFAEAKTDTSYLSDFEAYMPSYNATAGFIASGIFADGKLIGALVIQVPLDAIAATMESAKVLGETSDAYIMNKDGKFVTQAFRLAVKPGESGPSEIVTRLAGLLDDANSSILSYRGTDGHPTLSATGPVQVPYVSERGVHSSNLPVDERLPWLVSVRITKSELLKDLFSQIKLGVLLVITTTVILLALTWLATRKVMEPIQQIADGVQGMTASIREQARSIRAAIDGVVAAAEETSQQTVLVKQNSLRAAESSSSVAAAVEEMDASIVEISQSMGATDHKIFETRKQAEEAAEVMRRLEESASRIAEVLNLINDIADRTNLLALNAAIEAARAGDAGRGFAVVADEVKKLAESTIKATADIESQVGSVKTTSAEAVHVLSAIRDAITAVQDNATAVSGAVSQQSSATSEISQRVTETVTEVKQVDYNMSGIEEAAQNTGSSANEMLDAVRAMEDQFTKIQTELDRTLQQVGLKKS